MTAPPNGNERGPSAQGTALHDQHPTKDTEPSLASTIAAKLPPHLMTALVELLPDPAAEAGLRQQLTCEAYAAGLAEGYRRGYERGARVLEAEWPAVVAGFGGPTREELEAVRWGPGGRAHFGDPRPTDRFPRRALEAAS